MKVSKLMLLGMAGLAFTACTKDDVTTNGAATATGDTNATMTIKMATDFAARAGQADNNGLATEQNVSNVKVYVGSDEYRFTDLTPSNGSVTFDWKAKSTPDKVSFSVLVNAGTANYGRTSTSSLGDATTALTLMNTVANANNFLMSSPVEKKQIVAGVTKEMQTAATERKEELNMFSMVAERVVAKTVLKEGSNLANTVVNTDYYKTTDEAGRIVKSSIIYGIQNTGIKSYVFANNAGQRQYDATTLHYTGFKSIIDEMNSSEAYVTDYKKVANELFRYSNYTTAPTETEKSDYAALKTWKSTEAAKMGTYQAQGLAKKDFDLTKDNGGFYFLENSMEKGAFMNADFKQYGRARMAVAKIYAQYIPNEMKVYVPAELKITPNASTGKNDTTVVKPATTKVVLATDSTKAFTFYRGLTTGDIYRDVEAAALENGENNYVIYIDGWCGYQVLMNRLENASHIAQNCDVRRNNIYFLSLNSFKKVGFAWDKTDPNDPYLPGGNNPKPDPGQDLSIDRLDGNVDITLENKPWNVIERVLDLD